MKNFYWMFLVLILFSCGAVETEPGVEGKDQNTVYAVVGDVLFQVKEGKVETVNIPGAQLTLMTDKVWVVRNNEVGYRMLTNAGQEIKKYKGSEIKAYGRRVLVRNRSGLTVYDNGESVTFIPFKGKFRDYLVWENNRLITLDKNETLRVWELGPNYQLVKNQPFVQFQKVIDFAISQVHPLLYYAVKGDMEGDIVYSLNLYSGESRKVEKTPFPIRKLKFVDHATDSVLIISGAKSLEMIHPLSGRIEMGTEETLDVDYDTDEGLLYLFKPENIAVLTLSNKETVAEYPLGNTAK